jgi:hypothetical protein
MIRFNIAACCADRIGKRADTRNPHLCSCQFLGFLAVDPLLGGSPPGDT